MDNADVRDGILLATAFLNRLVDEGRVKLVFRKGHRRRITYHTLSYAEALGWAIHFRVAAQEHSGLSLLCRFRSSCLRNAGTLFKKRTTIHGP